MKLTLSLMALLCVIGCTRTEYRESADQQAYQILKEKSQDPRWRIPKMDITPDPASRFYDVHDLDMPPLPPDDPAASKALKFSSSSSTCCARSAASAHRRQHTKCGDVAVIT